MVIYKTTNLITGKIYVGKDARNRLAYLGSGTLLKRSLRKHGRENFTKEILEECSSLEELSLKEKFWIEKLDSRNPEIGYNILEGGEGGDSNTCSNIMKEMWKSLSETDKKTLSSKQLTSRWKVLSSEERSEKMAAINSHNTTEMRSETGKKVAEKYFTPEEISRRSKKGWANLTPEERKLRASLMKKKI